MSGSLTTTTIVTTSTTTTSTRALSAASRRQMPGLGDASFAGKRVSFSPRSSCILSQVGYQLVHRLARYATTAGAEAAAQPGDGMAQDLYLGIDVGSSGIKGVLVDASGRPAAVAELPHGISRPRSGWAEQDAERDWWAGAADVCRQLVDGRATQIAAVGVTGLGPCLVPADADGRPLRPAILYGIDTRATDQIARLTAELGADDDPRALWGALDKSIGRPQGALGRGGRTAGLGGHPARLRGDLLPGLPPHRRIRPRPPQRQPLGTAVRPDAERMDQGVGRARRARIDLAGPRLAAGDVRTGEPRGGCGDGPCRRHPRRRRHDRLVGRGGGRGAARARRGSAGLRDQHVPHRGRQPRAGRRAPVAHRRVLARVAQRRRRRGLERRPDGVAPRTGR